jgi:hypothetical protein
MKARLRPQPPARVQRVQAVTAPQARKQAAAPQPTLRVIDGGLDGGTLLRLQAAAGNQAVGALITGSPLSIQALSLGSLVRPAEAAAAAAGGEIAQVARPVAAVESVATTAVVAGEELAPASKPGQAVGSAAAMAEETIAGAAGAVEGAVAGGAGRAGEAIAGAAGAVGEMAAGGAGKAAGAAAGAGAHLGGAAARPAHHVPALGGPGAHRPRPAAHPRPHPGARKPAGGGPAKGAAGGPAVSAGASGGGAVRPVNPHEDAHFSAVAGRVGGVAGKQKSHPPARAKVAESENAAKGPGDEVASVAAAHKVDEMGAQKPKGFDRAAFIAAVHAAIERKSPKNMTEVRDFKSSGKAEEIKGEVAGNVAAGKEAAAGAIKASTEAPPNQAGIAPKPVVPMAPEAPGPHPPDVKPGDAMPARKPESEVSLAHTKVETDNQLAEANVTQEQVAESNEPQFHEAMDAKKEADEHAATAPKQFREDEQKQLGQAKAAAAVATTAGLSQMHQSRAAALGHVGTHKGAAKAKNEAERAKVAADIESIYNATKKDVDGILAGIDPKVGTTFDQGEKSAREAFENDYEAKRSAYFDKRYSGVRGKWRWVKDKFKGAPAEVNDFIVQAKQLYINKMEGVINDVANIVESDLNLATARIAEGRKQIADYVKKQPKDLKKIASEAASEISSKFDALDQAVTDKASDIVDDLADKYTSAMKEVDDRCAEMREANKGLLEKAKDKIKGMIEAIGKVKDMLSQMADKAAAVIGDIIAHPIRFLGNLISALKQGFGQFVDNIGKHLAQGLMGWLLGELGTAGITLPETFDLKGILHLVAQILGLTWENVRARAVEMLGPEVVGMIEQGVGMFQKITHIFTTLREQGLAGLWDMISDKIGDLKEMVMDKIQDFVVVKVITAGIKWVLGLLNPAGAFIKACMAIYDIVMFFINHGSEILALVNTILDNLAAIVAGNIGAAANLVESVLAKAIPMVIGFLASLLGVGGIGEKIKEVINAVRKPINKAMDWVLKSVVKPVAKAAARAVGWVKGKVKSGVDFLKKKGQAGVNWLKKKGQSGLAAVKKRMAAARDKFKSRFGKNDDRSPAEKQAALNAGMSEANVVTGDRSLTKAQVKSQLSAIRSKHQLAELRLVTDTQAPGHETGHVFGSINPSQTGPEIDREFCDLDEHEQWLQDAGLDQPVGTSEASAEELAAQPERQPILESTSADYCEHVLQGVINSSGATPKEKADALSVVTDQMAAARAATDGDAAFEHVRAAQSSANALRLADLVSVARRMHKKKPRTGGLQTHHAEPEVHEAPEIHPRTALERQRIPKKVAEQIKRLCLTPEEHAELRRLIKEQKFESKYDQPEKSIAEIEEVEMLVLTTTVHSRVHRERAAAGRE